MSILKEKNITRALKAAEWNSINGTVNNHVDGVQLQRVDTDGSTYGQFLLDMPFDMTNKGFVIKLKRLDANLSRLGVEFRVKSRDFGKRFESSINVDAIALTDTILSIQPQGCAFYGGAVISDLQDFRMLNVLVFPVDISQPVAIVIEEIKIVDTIHAPGGAVITFDDGYTSTYTLAYPKMKQYGFKGCVYVETGNVGDVGKLTISQLTDLYNDGWDICSHTKTGGELDDSLSVVQEQLRDSQQWLSDNGFYRSMRHMSYPGGYFDDMVLNEVEKLYLSGRIVGGTSDDSMARCGWVACDRYKLYNLYCTSTLETGVENTIVNKLSGGGVCIFTFHSIINGAPDRNEDWSLTRFSDFIDNLYENNTSIMRLTDLYED